MPIFEPAELASFAFEYGLSPAVIARKLSVIQRLRSRNADGSLTALTETSAEQSFNEKLFAEVFDYRTLLRSGAARYHLRPKGYHPKTKRYDDFSLGFFGLGRRDRIVVSAELKAPGAILDAPQDGQYKGLTPAEQAFRAAPSCVRWVIVSNLLELRLYARDEPNRYESVLLDEVLSAGDLLRAYALFSRKSLVGTQSSRGRLDRLYKKELRMLVPKRDNHVRLVHEASINTREAQYLSALEQVVAERLAHTRPWSLLGFPVVTEVVGDRVVVELCDKTGPHFRLEATAMGTLRISEAISTTDFSHKVLIERLGWSCALVPWILRAFGMSPVKMQSRLLEVQSAKFSATGQTSSTGNPILVRPKAGVSTGEVPLKTYEQNCFPRPLSDKFCEAVCWQVRDLLLAFTAETMGLHQPARLVTTPEYVRSVLLETGVIAMLPSM